MTPDNRIIHMSRDPQLSKCNPQLSNLQHAVGYSTDGVFKFKDLLSFIIVRRNYLLNNSIQFNSMLYFHI